MTTAEKIANDVRLVLFTRLAMLLMPLLVSAGTGLLWKVYTGVEAVQEAQSKAITDLQMKVQEHQLVLENGRQSRLEFQARTESQFSGLDGKAERLLDGINELRESVVRVQTIVETRLPQKATMKGLCQWPQQ